MHSLGLILCGMLLLATRERRVAWRWLISASVLFGCLFAMHGRTLDAWMVLMTLGLSSDPASAVVDAVYAVVWVAGWLLLAVWARRCLDRIATGPSTAS